MPPTDPTPSPDPNTPQTTITVDVDAGLLAAYETKRTAYNAARAKANLSSNGAADIAASGAKAVADAAVAAKAANDAASATASADQAAADTAHADMDTAGQALVANITAEMSGPALPSSRKPGTSGSGCA